MDYLTALKSYKPLVDQERADLSLITQCILHFKDLLSRNNKVAHLTGSSLIFNSKRDKILMAHHNIYDVWTWTGGHADGEKDMLAVAIKEAKEETGLTEVKPITDELIAVDVLAVNSHYKNNCFIPAHLHINLSYALEADETQLLQAKADENSAVAWWSIEEALQFAKEKEPRIAEVYEKIIKRVKTIEEGKTFKEDDRS